MPVGNCKPHYQEQPHGRCHFPVAYRGVTVVWVEKLPLNGEGQVIVPYAGQHNNGDYTEGVIDKETLLELLGEVPESESLLWKKNIDFWKVKGFIE